MVKEYKCPICDKSGLKIDIANGYKIVFEGKLSDLPCRIYCKNCRRLIKYNVVKSE